MSLAHYYPGREVRCEWCHEWSPASEWELVGDENSECPSCGGLDFALTIPQSRPITDEEQQS